MDNNYYRRKPIITGEKEVTPPVTPLVEKTAKVDKNTKDKRRVVTLNESDDDIREFLNNNPVGNRFSAYVKDLIRKDMNKTVTVNLDDLVTLLQGKGVAYQSPAPTPVESIIKEETKSEVSEQSKKALTGVLGMRKKKQGGV